MDKGEKKFFLPRDRLRRLLPRTGGCFATDRIMVDGEQVGYMYREAAHRPEDTGWRFFAGDESQEYIDDLRHTDIYEVNTVANFDPDVIPYVDAAAPCAFEKIAGTHKYRPVDPPIAEA